MITSFDPATGAAFDAGIVESRADHVSRTFEASAAATVELEGLGRSGVLEVTHVDKLVSASGCRGGPGPTAWH